jgi:transporter family protein
VFFQKTGYNIFQIERSSGLFLILSGIATGLSWLFYFRALQIGEASKVVPIDKLSLVITILFAGIFLKEKITMQTLFGATLMTIGAIIIAFAK